MFSIGQLAKKAKVSNRTLRYYEELGLISPKTRGENRYRYYDDSHMNRLMTIKLLQESGFALKEIVATLSPALDPGSHISNTGQEMAKKVYEALSDQRLKLIDRQKEISSTIEDIAQTLKALQECFGCKNSASPQDCANCSSGPREVTDLAKQCLEKQKTLDKAPLSYENVAGAK